DARRPARVPQPRPRDAAHLRDRQTRRRQRHRRGRVRLDVGGQPLEQQRQRGRRRGQEQDLQAVSKRGMNLGAALRQLWADFSALFESSAARSWFLIGAATVLQVAFWYLATPGPALLRFSPQSLSAAADGISWTVAILLLAPALLQLLVGGNLRELGLRRGDHRYGLRAAAVSSVVAISIIALSYGHA